MEKGRWEDPRDNGYEAIYANSGTPEEATGKLSEMLRNLPVKPDWKFMHIICSNSSHDEEPVIYSYIVQYVRGNPDPPKFIRQLSHIGPSGFENLIRDELPTGLRLFEELDENEYQLTSSGQRHLEKTGQWREKINLRCICGENVPIRDLSRFMEFTKMAIEKEIYDIPLIFFRIAKLPPK